MIESLWDIDQVSVYLGVPVATLYRWRTTGYGPPCGRVGKHLRYEAEAVRDWFRAQLNGAA